MKQSYYQMLSLPPNISFNGTYTDRIPQQNIDQFVNGLQRPAWYRNERGDSSRDTQLFLMEVRYPFQVVQVFGRIERVWQCQACGSPMFYSGVHIGHHPNQWRAELKLAGVMSAETAKAAYNNLNNLRLECATCNTSHDWE